MVLKMLSKLFNKKSPSKERREESRYKTDFQFVLEFKDKDDEAQIEEFGSCRDISIHGIRFATKKGLKQGSLLNLVIHFPGEFEGAKNLALQAEVIHIFHPHGASRNRVGCRLHHEDEASSKVIAEFIDWIRSRVS